MRSDRSRMRFDQVTDDRQPDAESPLGMSQRLGILDEPIEGMRQY